MGYNYPFNPYFPFTIYNIRSESRNFGNTEKKFTEEPNASFCCSDSFQKVKLEMKLEPIKFKGKLEKIKNLLFQIVINTTIGETKKTLQNFKDSELKTLTDFLHYIFARKIKLPENSLNFEDDRKSIEFFGQYFQNLNDYKRFKNQSRSHQINILCNKTHHHLIKNLINLIFSDS